MKFKMNNREWEIVELSQDDIRQVFKDYKWDGEPKEGRYFGLTYFDCQKIYIDKDLCMGQKIQTLAHELMHCYIGSYISNSGLKTYTEEDLCDICANSYLMIDNIIFDFYDCKNGNKQSVGVLEAENKEKMDDEK